MSKVLQRIETLERELARLKQEVNEECRKQKTSRCEELVQKWFPNYVSDVYHILDVHLKPEIAQEFTDWHMYLTFCEVGFDGIRDEDDLLNLFIEEYQEDLSFMRFNKGGIDSEHFTLQYIYERFEEDQDAQENLFENLYDYACTADFSIQDLNVLVEAYLAEREKDYFTGANLWRK